MPPTDVIASRLPAALPLADIASLRALLAPVLLPHKQTFSNPGAPIKGVYFLEEGIRRLHPAMRGGQGRTPGVGRADCPLSRA
jgi:hypothetical protein